jgi:hypothetical protein
MTTQETPATNATFTDRPERLFGLTIDNVSDEKTIIELLETIKSEAGRVPMIRIVFDGDKNPSHYRRVIKKIKDKQLGGVMGELLDSSAVNGYRENRNQISEKRYRERAEAYLTEFNKLVDIWEVGNEMNGEWVGYGGWESEDWTAADMESIRDTYALAVGQAYKVFTDAGKDTALTFYFNDDDVRHTWADGTKRESATSSKEVPFGHHHSMLKWAKTYSKHFPKPKYVFVSYYEDDQFADEAGTGKRTRIIPAADKWASIFQRLHEDYQGANFGFGEMGAQCYFRVPAPACVPQENDEKFKALKAKQRCVLVKRGERGDHRRCECCLDAQREYIARYYVDWDRDIRLELGRLSPEGLAKLYVGGYFYWHFNDDVINKITRSEDASTPTEEKRKLKQEATDTLNALIAAFRKW